MQTRFCCPSWLYFTALVSAGLSCGLAGPGLQDPAERPGETTGRPGSEAPPASGETNAAAERIDQLERRLASLEQILFAQSVLDVREARRRLDRAREQLQGTRELFLRGMAADVQLEQDRFAVLIAERELELVQNPGLHRALVRDLDVLDATRRLELARRNLDHTENLNRRGFASLTQIAEAKREVAAAESALELAQRQLDAARQLDQISPKPPETGVNPADQ